jgi:acyl carrier protein
MRGGVSVSKESWDKNLNVTLSPKGDGTMADYKDEIRSLIAQIGEVEIDRVGDETHLSTDLGLDSLRALELMVALEDKFKIRVPEEELGRFTNVSSLAELVTELQTVTVQSVA